MTRASEEGAVVVGDGNSELLFHYDVGTEVVSGVLGEFYVGVRGANVAVTGSLNRKRPGTA